MALIFEGQLYFDRLTREVDDASLSIDLRAFNCSFQLSRSAQNTATAPANSAKILPGLGTLHHPTSTTSPEAQQFFDQGLRLIYAFNHEEANRSFQRALQLDPKFAMAWWGIAVAVGPNYNLPVDADHEKIAADAVKHALDLSHSSPPVEQDYINAIATRFSSCCQSRL